MNRSSLSHDFWLVNRFPFIILLLLAMGCNSGQEDVTEIVMAFGPDDTGTLKALIDNYNLENGDNIHVVWKAGARSSDNFYHELVGEFSSGSPTFDLVGSDVIWTPAFAENGWVEDLTEYFFSKHEPQDFIGGAMESVSYQQKVWGIPWYTDMGLLYYRKDLLDSVDVENPPTTWSALASTSSKIMMDQNLESGFAFQGANYEGGTTNACEFIWNAGGEILMGDLYQSVEGDNQELSESVITVDSREAALGLNDLQLLIDEGVVHPKIASFRELESADAFKNGEVAFLRSWTSSYGYLLTPDSKVSPDQLGFSIVPTSGEDQQSYSCLGGWNLMIPSGLDGKKKEAVLKFVDYLASSESQQFRAVNGGILPTLRSLYDDALFLQRAPIVDFAKDFIPYLKERPKSPDYMKMSPIISKTFYQVLNNEGPVDDLLADLHGNLQSIVQEN